jgi:hypothetical protein
MQSVNVAKSITLPAKLFVELDNISQTERKPFPEVHAAVLEIGIKEYRKRNGLDVPASA